MSEFAKKSVRSRMTANIMPRDTGPELLIRKGLFSRGYRFRLHCSNLPGKPDIVLKKYTATIFVHGCFWHGHQCHLFKWPKTRAEFWKKKILGNMDRDRDRLEKLAWEGWRSLVVWECGLKGKFRLVPDELLDRVESFLVGKASFHEITPPSVGRSDLKPHGSP